MALVDGKTINMKDHYQNRLDPQNVSEIFDNDDNMKTLLLTAATRGHGDQIESWLTWQKISAQDNIIIPRPDINGQALFYTQRLLYLMKTKHSDKSKTAQQNHLQQIHANNWKIFKKSIDRHKHGSLQHNHIVRNSIDRIGSVKMSRLLPLRC